MRTVRANVDEGRVDGNQLRLNLDADGIDLEDTG